MQLNSCFLKFVVLCYGVSQSEAYLVRQGATIYLILISLAVNVDMTLLVNESVAVY